MANVALTTPITVAPAATHYEIVAVNMRQDIQQLMIEVRYYDDGGAPLSTVRVTAAPTDVFAPADVAGLFEKVIAYLAKEGRVN